MSLPELLSNDRHCAAYNWKIPFVETYKRRAFEQATGVDPEFVQNNFYFS